MSVYYLLIGNDQGISMVPAPSQYMRGGLCSAHSQCGACLWQPSGFLIPLCPAETPLLFQK